MAAESSRIFVRGLPPKFTDEDVRKHFSKYPVTDVKFFPHRRIGYVGYKTPEDAAKAVKYFNRTFIRMSKISVEIARPIADQQLPPSRRQQKDEKTAPHNAAYVPPPRDNALKRKADEVAEEDPKLKEYLEMMKAPSKTNIFTNNDAQLGIVPQATDAPQEVAVPDGESDDEYQVIEKKRKTTHIAEQPSVEPAVAPKPVEIPSMEKVNDADSTEMVQGTENVPMPDAAPVTDADWLRSRTNRVLDLVEDDDAPPRPVAASVPTSQPKAPAEPKAGEPIASGEMEVDQPETSTQNATEAAETPSSEEDKIRQTARLYLRNLNFDVTKDDLDEHFSKYGPIEEVHVPSKKIDGKGKGFAFVQFKDPEHAVEAFNQNDGTIFQGRLLHILSAETKRDTKLDEFAIAKLPLKKQRELKRKADAAGKGFNWNSLYLNTDAVMSAIAERFGVSKSDVLDPTSSDAAVRLAHAETHIINEIKNYFVQHGVDLESFKRSSRGDTTILVKNIPHSAKSEEIRQLFEEHGTVKRFLMPPAGMTAIVEFPNATQASVAFRSLAYKKLKDSILYLEKAPKDLFKEGFVAPAETETRSTEAPGTTTLAATDLLQDAPEAEATNTATLFVRNLNFSTTTQRLTEIFSPLEGFRSATVKTKIDPKRGVLSMGFGFVEFNDAKTASAAQRAMDGYTLDKHALKIQASHKGADAAEERRKEDALKKAGSTKIIIKNLPFEASKKDIRALFAPYGQLRSVRVPKKFDSSSRGFGFAEFTTKRDAANAIESLRNTHLLGRKLVLGYAEVEGEDAEKELEKMTEKVGKQANKVALQKLTGGGRKKFNIAGGEEDLED